MRKLPGFGNLARVEDLDRRLNAELRDFQKHASGCSSCSQIWNAIPARLSLEEITRMPDVRGWCVQGKGIFAQRVAGYAKSAIAQLL